jgi:hypothetical protein
MSEGSHDRQKPCGTNPSAFNHPFTGAPFGRGRPDPDGVDRYRRGGPLKWPRRRRAALYSSLEIPCDQLHDDGRDATAEESDDPAP